MQDRHIRGATDGMLFVLWMLCREEDISSNPRLQKCLKEGECLVCVSPPRSAE